VKTYKKLNNIQYQNETHEFTMEYLYDYLGRIENIKYPANSSLVQSETVYYEYDSGGQINRVTGGYNGSSDPDFTYVDKIYYDEFGQRVFMKYGNGIETTYTYHKKRRWLEQIMTRSENGSKVIQDITYTFNSVGNIDKVENKDFDNDGYVKSVTQEYQYDDLYQLVESGRHLS